MCGGMDERGDGQGSEQGNKWNGDWTRGKRGVGRGQMRDRDRMGAKWGSEGVGRGSNRVGHDWMGSGWEVRHGVDGGSDGERMGNGWRVGWDWTGAYWKADEGGIG